MADVVVTTLNYDTDLLVTDLARRFAIRSRQRDTVAVVAGPVRRTWAELDDRVTRLSGALAARGVLAGDRIAVCIPNCVEFFEIVLAVAALGAATVPLSYRATSYELAQGLDIADAARLFVQDGELYERAVAALELRTTPTELIGLGAEYEELITTGGTEPVERPSEDDAVWFAMTGGTTGRPKLVRVPHRVIVQMWLMMSVELGIRRSDVMLIPGPLYHGLGFGFGLQQLYVGGRVVLMDSFDPAETLRLIAAERVTVLPAVPTMLNLLLARPELADTDTSSLRLIMSSGSSLLTPTKERLLAAFPQAELYESYGATEAGFFTVLRPEDQFRKVRSVGQPFFGSDVRVFDADGRDVAPGEIGLIYKRGLIEGGGYADDPIATQEMFRDGWCTAGDLGYRDEEGYLYLVDRQKDMIVTGGVNVYPAEIEEVLSAVPGVAEVAVIGVPDDTWGELVKAVIVRSDGAAGARLDARAVDHACRERLARFKRPRLVEFAPTLPKSLAGKVLKRELRREAQFGMQSVHHSGAAP